MKYKLNPNKPEGKARAVTYNNHVVIWAAMLKLLRRGPVSRTRLEAICLKLGEGQNKGNTIYLTYIINKLNWLVPA